MTKPLKLERAVVGLALWLISLGTCFACETTPETISRARLGLVERHVRQMISDACESLRR